MLHKKIKVEDCKWIKVYPLIKQLEVNQEVSILKEDGCAISVSLLHNKNKECIKLVYFCNTTDGEVHYVTQEIKLTKTECYIAGNRYWFLCSCNKLCYVLYKPENQIYFACRDCYNLTYASRNSRHRKFITAFMKEQMLKELRTKMYNLQPTRRYLAIKEKIRKNHEGISRMLELSNKKRMNQQIKK